WTLHEKIAAIKYSLESRRAAQVRADREGGRLMTRPVFSGSGDLSNILNSRLNSMASAWGRDRYRIARTPCMSPRATAVEEVTATETSRGRAVPGAREPVGGTSRAQTISAVVRFAASGRRMS